MSDDSVAPPATVTPPDDSVVPADATVSKAAKDSGWLTVLKGLLAFKQIKDLFAKAKEISDDLSPEDAKDLNDFMQVLRPVNIQCSNVVHLASEKLKHIIRYGEQAAGQLKKASVSDLVTARTLTGIAVERLQSADAQLLKIVEAIQDVQAEYKRVKFPKLLPKKTFATAIVSLVGEVVALLATAASLIMSLFRKTPAAEHAVTTVAAVPEVLVAAVAMKGVHTYNTRVKDNNDAIILATRTMEEIGKLRAGVDASQTGLLIPCTYLKESIERLTGAINDAAAARDMQREADKDPTDNEKAKQAGKAKDTAETSSTIAETQKETALADALQDIEAMLGCFRELQDSQLKTLTERLAAQELLADKDDARAAAKKLKEGAKKTDMKEKDDTKKEGMKKNDDAKKEDMKDTQQQTKKKKRFLFW